MPQVSKFPIKEEVFKEIFELLLRVVVESRNTKEAEDLLDDLLSPIEKIMLAKRLAIAVLLSKGYSYDTVQKVLRVSRPTVGMVSMQLKYKGEGFRNFANKIIKEEKNKEFWNKIEDLVLGTMSNVKGGMAWRYLHSEIKNDRWKKIKAI